MTDLSLCSQHFRTKLHAVPRNLAGHYHELPSLTRHKIYRMPGWSDEKVSPSTDPRFGQSWALDLFKSGPLLKMSCRNSKSEDDSSLALPQNTARAPASLDSLPQPRNQSCHCCFHSSPPLNACESWPYRNTMGPVELPLCASSRPNSGTVEDNSKAARHPESIKRNRKCTPTPAPFFQAA